VAAAAQSQPSRTDSSPNRLGAVGPQRSATRRAEHMTGNVRVRDRSWTSRGPSFLAPWSPLSPSIRVRARDTRSRSAIDGNIQRQRHGRCTAATSGFRVVPNLKGAVPGLGASASCATRRRAQPGGGGGSGPDRRRRAGRPSPRLAREHPRFRVCLARLLQSMAMTPASCSPWPALQPAAAC
jgi:hypothetical protein